MEHFHSIFAPAGNKVHLFLNFGKKTRYHLKVELRVFSLEKYNFCSRTVRRKITHQLKNGCFDLFPLLNLVDLVICLFAHSCVLHV